MARLIITKEVEFEMKRILNKYKKYNFKQTDRDNIIKLLVSCSNNFCPFTGVLFPDRKFSIEHFHIRQATDKTKSIEFENLYPCCQDANVPTKQRPLTLDPKIVDYVDRLYIDTNDFLVKPKDENDKEAQDTIEQFSLNKNNQLQKYRRSEYTKKFILKTNFATKYSFSEYFD